jgi:hypothetical protein
LLVVRESVLLSSLPLSASQWDELLMQRHPFCHLSVLGLCW